MRNNKGVFALLIIMVFFSSIIISCFDEIQPSQSVVTISLSIAEFEQDVPNGRLDTVSTFQHILPQTAEIILTNKESGEVFSQEYNPSQDTEIKLNVPFGSYTFSSSVVGGTFSSFLPFSFSGEVTVDNQLVNVDANAVIEYALVTLKKDYIKSVTIQNGSMNDLVNSTFFYTYVKGGTVVNMNIVEDVNGSEISRQFTVSPSKHYNFVLKITRGNIIIPTLNIEPFSYDEEVIEIGADFNVGDTITIIAEPNAGFAFERWEYNGNPLEGGAEIQFIIPANEVNITAHFKQL